MYGLGRASRVEKRGIIISRRLQKMRAMFISPVIVFYGRFVTDCVQTVRDLVGTLISGKLGLDCLLKLGAVHKLCRLKISNF